MIQSLLASLRPDGELLLSEISKRITDDMLAEIALADYGRDQERHLAALRHLRDTGSFLEPMELYPCEVLELVRNWPPGDWSWTPGSDGGRAQWIRAFACAALLRAEQDPWNYGAGASPSFTLIHLIESLSALPVDLTSHAVSFVAWLMLHSDLEGRDEQVVYYGVGLLWLALHLHNPASDKALTELAQWIVRREEEFRQSIPWAFDRWLLGIGRDPPPSRWECLGQKLCELDLTSHGTELQDWAKLIGTELAGR